jgi:hypothetical protein
MLDQEVYEFGTLSCDQHKFSPLLVKQSYTSKSVFQKIVFEGGLYTAEKGIEKGRVVIVKKIYFEKNFTVLNNLLFCFCGRVK